MDLDGRTIAVHYNHTAQTLSIRAVDPTTGEPGRHLTTSKEVFLRNAVFASRDEQWKEAQKPGSRTSKQTGEIKGTVTEPGKTHEEMVKVLYNPKERSDFHLEDGTRVYYAEYVHIDGAEIYALNPQ